MYRPTLAVHTRRLYAPDMTQQSNQPPGTIPAWVEGELHPVDKLSVHHRGLRHPAVSVFLFVGDELLIQRRALDKYHTPGLWANTCCTHPLWGEVPEQCAIRRLEEELGISGVNLTSKGHIEYRADVGGNMIEHEVVDLFLATPETRPTITPNPREASETAWITLPELEAAIESTPEKYTPWLRIYVERHRDRLVAE